MQQSGTLHSYFYILGESFQIVLVERRRKIHFLTPPDVSSQGPKNVRR